MRFAEISRVSNETQIKITLNLDGSGKSSIQTPVAFLNHQLELFSRHGFFDLTVEATGDVEVDYHHIMEDTGMVLGMAIDKALQERKGIRRYGQSLLPMDETLIMIALDLSGRAGLYYDVKPVPPYLVKDIDMRLFHEFFQALCGKCGMNLHIRQLAGEENHHIIEGIFKGFARALDQATGNDPRIQGVLSTKGKLDI